MLIERRDYWTHPAISQSMMADFDVSPFHFYAKHIAKIVPPEDTQALRVGQAFHAALLEPDNFDARFPCFDGHLRSNEAKAAFAAMDETAALLDGCAIRDRDQIDGMVAGVRANRFARMLLDGMTHAEVPIVWDCADTNVQCRARLDGVASVRGSTIVFDLKSMSEPPTQANVERAIGKYGMHRQAVHYLAAAEAQLGKKPDDYYLICVEKSAPFACAVYPIDGETLAIADQWRRATLTDIAMRRESNQWDFQETITGPIGLPMWARRTA